MFDDGPESNFVGPFLWICSLRLGERNARQREPAHGFGTTLFFRRIWALVLPVPDLSCI
jgi:hypothetical protein